MNNRDRKRAPASPPMLSATAASGGYSTRAPEKYAGNAGIAAPCSQCAISRWPADRYRASSWKAVLLHTSRIDKAACSETTGTSSHPAGTCGLRADDAARGDQRFRPAVPVTEWRGARLADLAAMPDGSRFPGGAAGVTTGAHAGLSAG